MHGYQVPAYDSNLSDCAGVTVTDTTQTQVIAAPGPGKRIMITWIWVYNRSTQLTGVKLFSGTDQKGKSLPAPASGGAAPPLPTPIILGENKAFQIQTEDVANSLDVTVGYVIGPKAY